MQSENAILSFGIPRHLHKLPYEKLLLQVRAAAATGDCSMLSEPVASDGRLWLHANSILQDANQPSLSSRQRGKKTRISLLAHGQC